MDKVVCPECRLATKVVVDHGAGDMVCMECGLVLEARSIDETFEWRTFSNEHSSNDPVRVGEPSNRLLADGGISTIIAPPNGEQGGSFKTSLSLNPDRSLIFTFRTIAAMADRLGLVGTIKDRANEIFKNVGDVKPVKGRRTRQDSIMAACVYIACRQEGTPRTFKEICSVANGASTKDIGRATTLIVKQLQENMGMPINMGSIHPEDFMKRFCTSLGMDKSAVRAATDTVRRLEQLDLRKSTISKTAAAIYMISQLSHVKTQLEEISNITGAAESTIRSTYKNLYPHAAEIIPEWFANEAALGKLCAP